MKLFTFIFAFCVTVSLIQAHKLMLVLDTLYEEIVPTNGKITLLLKGETETKEVVVNQTVFESTQDINFETEFDQDVEDVRVTWVSESEKPIYLYYLAIISDKHQGSIFAMAEHAFNGVPKDFHITSTFPV